MLFSLRWSGKGHSLPAEQRPGRRDEGKTGEYLGIRIQVDRTARQRFQGRMYLVCSENAKEVSVREGEGESEEIREVTGQMMFLQAFVSPQKDNSVHLLRLV